MASPALCAASSLHGALLWETPSLCTSLLLTKECVAGHLLPVSAASPLVLSPSSHLDVHLLKNSSPFPRFQQQKNTYSVIQTKSRIFLTLPRLSTLSQTS